MTNLLIIPTIKAAVEAFQSADRGAWKRLFTSKADLYEDGSPSDLERFTREALGHDYFLSIDRVANNGLYIEGDFNSAKNGISRIYFNFELNDSGKIKRLDIGRVENTD
ncbi:hypothetical protein H7846_06955 [Edaphobacter sp. 4G125]|nr:hypothetical protein H7846_06955 [Edaphobacter sp. 4G125]